MVYTVFFAGYIRDLLIFFILNTIEKLIDMFYFKYKNETYTFDPNLPIPCPEFDEDGVAIAGYGQTLKEFLGMTDSEVLIAVSEGNWNAVRFERDTLLSKLDWTQGYDVPDNIKLKWQSYRQSLRDITNQSDPLNVTWPTEPS
jgi:hypothetical protein